MSKVHCIYDSYGYSPTSQIFDLKISIDQYHLFLHMVTINIMQIQSIKLWQIHCLLFRLCYRLGQQFVPYALLVHQFEQINIGLSK